MPFLIATITVTRFDRRLCVFAHVLAQRSADVLFLIEASLVVTPNVTLVVAGVDQFAFAVMLLISHFATPPLRISSAKQQTWGHKKAQEAQKKCFVVFVLFATLVLFPDTGE